MSESDDKKSGSGVSIVVPQDVTRDLAHFFMRIAGPIAAGSDFLSQKIRYFQFKSAMKILRRAKEITDEAGMPVKEVPIKFLVPFLEKCSLEDENSDLVERWANLLASAAAEYSDRHATFADILSQISGIDAKLLRAIWNKHDESKQGKLQLLLDSFGEPIDERTLSGQQVISVDRHNEGSQFLVMAGTEPQIDSRLMLHENFAGNIESLLILERQSLIRIKAGSGLHKGDKRRTYVVSAVLTPLGYDFVVACERPKSDLAG